MDNALGEKGYIFLERIDSEVDATANLLFERRIEILLGTSCKNDLCKRYTNEKSANDILIRPTSVANPLRRAKVRSEDF